MTNGKALIREEPLEVKHISWETRATFRMVAMPRKVLERGYRQFLTMQKKQ